MLVPMCVLRIYSLPAAVGLFVRRSKASNCAYNNNNKQMERSRRMVYVCPSGRRRWFATEREREVPGCRVLELAASRL